MTFRNGQWVIYDRRVGIYQGARPKGMGEVHLVDVKGDTEMIVIVENVAIRPARRQHIPAARLKTSSKRALDKFYPVEKRQ